MKRILSLAALALPALAFGPTAHATLISYEAFLDGPSESPPNASPGTGYATVVIDDGAQTMAVHIEFSGLLGTTTAAHIHGPTAAPGTGTAGVITTTPTFTGFPLGVTSGTYDNILDLTLASSFNPAFITANGGTTAGAEAALLASLAGGTAYLNIHTTFAPGGEIRGFFTPRAAASEPATLTLFAIGALGAGVAARRRRP